MCFWNESPDCPLTMLWLVSCKGLGACKLDSFQIKLNSKIYARSQCNPAADRHSVHRARWKLVRRKNSCNAFSVYIGSSLTQWCYLLIRSYFIALIANADIGFLCCTQQHTDMSLPGDDTYPEVCNKSGSMFSRNTCLK